MIERNICVYGASPAGLTAALQAKAAGKSVTLIAQGQHIGGMLVEGLGSQDINNNGTQNQLVIGGLSREFYQRVGAKYGEAFTSKFECHVAEEVIEEWIAEAGIEVFRNERLAERDSAVLKEGSCIREIEMESGNRFRATVFIDATIEGDLMKWAGISFTTGREGNATYGESLNGIRESSYRQFEVDVDPYTIPGNSSSGLIATVQDEPKGKPGDGDNNIMGFCFRQCLTQDPANQLPFRKPVNYDPANYEIYRRYLAAGGRLFTPVIKLPKGKTDLGSWHDLSGNLYGYNHGWPDGSYAERQAIYDDHKDFIEGLYWFLCHDPAVPSELQAEWSTWGLAADEFIDNQGWPRSLYIRTGRRMISDYVITEAHTKGKVVAEDAIGVAWWPPDAHHARRIVENGVVRNEGFFFEHDYVPFPISYRAMIPKRSQCTNLLVPAALSSSYVGYGSVRLEWTQMVCGQSAALAAVEALKTRADVQSIDYAKLRNRLLDAGQILEVPATTGAKLGIQDASVKEPVPET
ncbi:FAD-dependent oxidoreductase [Puniceicoccus vermicola]|nr:FAD-dependent oxidoreductase [Puniceicoccus vermicola]